MKGVNKSALILSLCTSSGNLDFTVVNPHLFFWGGASYTLSSAGSLILIWSLSNLRWVTLTWSCPLLSLTHVCVGDLPLEISSLLGLSLAFYLSE